MKNILRVFKNDLNKIHNNVYCHDRYHGYSCYSDSLCMVQYCSQLGSVWQYGWPENRRGSEDAGYTSELINVDLNLGDDVIKALKENDNFKLGLYRCR